MASASVRLADPCRFCPVSSNRWDVDSQEEWHLFWARLRCGFHRILQRSQEEVFTFRKTGVDRGHTSLGLTWTMQDSWSFSRFFSMGWVPPCFYVTLAWYHQPSGAWWLQLQTLFPPAWRGQQCISAGSHIGWASLQREMAACPHCPYLLGYGASSACNPHPPWLFEAPCCKSCPVFCNCEPDWGAWKGGATPWLGQKLI